MQTKERRRLTPAEREAMQHEALTRAASGQSWANYPTIIREFMAKGIPADDIRPRENVFTYHAWRALGRQVRRGEHGVRVVTFIKDLNGADRVELPEQGKEGEQAKRRGGSRPWSAVVFHISQTDPIAK